MRSRSNALTDLRYVGQLHSVTVPIADLTEEGFAGAVAAFHDEHLRQYRYSHPENPVETSTLRVAAQDCGRSGTCARCATRRATGRRSPSASATSTSTLTAGCARASSTGTRSPRATQLQGPCVVEELDGTVVVPPGRNALVDGVGNLIIALDVAQ